VNFVHASHVIFGANTCLAPHPSGTHEKYNTGIFLIRPTPRQRMTPVALGSWWGNCWHWWGKCSTSLYVKIP